MPDILQRDGLTIEILKKLSYKSSLGINLKKNLHYFDKEQLLEEIKRVNAWYDRFSELHELALDYRIKSIQSAMLKYERYYPEHQARKVFDDLLGFRSLCDSYEDVLELKDIGSISFDKDTIILYIISFLVTMVVTYFAFELLLLTIRKSKFIYFTIYCEIIGLITLIFGLVK